ncbi:hypothetical protein [Glycomyces terrestris]|uniref:Uncharacterized protein n=1 Tax=Glycomyces terrestris TaxID=2493553 RepID=A0A426UV27_9ACTN|nr:hypothetical protein [Glycomyces terrestris]RRR98187.1 hypothetical protein EIW28_14815 [Glycomyces terrestris]
MIDARAFLKRLGATGALLAVAAACGAEPDGDSAADAEPSTAAETATEPAPTSEAASPPAPRPSESEEPEADDPAQDDPAQDGGGACGEDACEVSFSESTQFTVAGDDGLWTVEASFEDGGVRVSLTDPDGLGGGGGLLYQASCALTLNGDGSGGLGCDHASAPAPDAGGFVAYLAEMDGTTAVLQVALG